MADTQLPAQPWYASGVQKAQVIAAITGFIAAFPKIGQWLGLTNPGQIADAVTGIFAFASVASTLYGAVSRARSSIQPLTLTRAAADSHPQTLATQGKSNASPLPATPVPAPVPPASNAPPNADGLS